MEIVSIFGKNLFAIKYAIFKTYAHAQEFEQYLLDLSDQSEEAQSSGLEEVFRQLDNLQFQNETLGKNKAKASWLRLYALRVDRNVYIITGGAIKLTQLMQEREHTNHELEKIAICRDYLLSQGIVDVDGVIEEMES